MKNIHSYKRFRELKHSTVNEGLFDKLKNLLGKMFNGISDAVSKPMSEFTKKLQNTKPGDVGKLTKDFMNAQRNSLTEQLKGADSLAKVRKVMKDNVLGTYSTMDAVSKFTGNEEISPKALMAEAGGATQKQFSNEEEGFMNGLDQFTKELFLNVAKQSGYKDEELKDLPEKVDDVETKEGEQQKGEEKGNEQSSEVEKTAQGTNEAQAQPAKEGQQDQQAQQAKPDKRLDELKKNASTWFDNTIFKKIDAAADKLGQGGDPMSKLKAGIDVNKIDSTQNKEGVAKLIDRVASAQKDPSANNKKLAAVRNALVQGGFGTDDDYGKF